MFFRNKKREVIGQAKYSAKDYLGLIVNEDAATEPYKNKSDNIDILDAQSKSWNG